VVRTPLHDHIPRLQDDLARIENQHEFTLDHDDIIQRPRPMHHGSLAAVLEPVSYTHLDVYKRQARLSEDSRRTVCLLEAGGSGRSVFIKVPGAIVMAQRSASLNWRFQSVPQAELNGRRIPVPRGRGLGGSALINGMVYFRGNPRDYDAWAAAGAAGWSYREILPYFRRSEHNENFGSSVYLSLIHISSLFDLLLELRGTSKVPTS